MSIYDYSNTVQKAASRTRGTHSLQTLGSLCEQQKSISTSKVMRLVEEIKDDFVQDAIHFRYLADRIKQLETQLEAGRMAHE